MILPSMHDRRPPIPIRLPVDSDLEPTFASLIHDYPNLDSLLASQMHPTHQMNKSPNNCPGCAEFRGHSPKHVVPPQNISSQQIRQSSQKNPPTEAVEVSLDKVTPAKMPRRRIPHPVRPWGYPAQPTE